MRRLNTGWSFGPPLCLFLSTLLFTLTAHAISIRESDLITLGKPILPTYYKPDTDEICFRNGIRYVNCSPDEGRLVKLDSIDRSNLLELVQRKRLSAGTIQNLVYVMLVDLDRELTVSHDEGKGGSMKDMAEKEWNRETLKGKSLSEKQSDIDPSILGPAAATKLGAPSVTDEEERCYTHWLKTKNFAEADVGTVLNELYVRHVAITQGDKKVWEMVSPTGCYQNPGTMTAGEPSLSEADKLKESLSTLPLQQRSLSPEQDKDGDGIPDDMKVYHPTFGTHLKDPWADKRHNVTEKTGHTRRSLSSHGRVSVNHEHGRRSANPFTPSDLGADYTKNMPRAPVSGAAGSGSVHTVSSAISTQPHGFASSVTGGGSVSPIVPKDIHELTSLLTDAQPRVIHLDKVYDYTRSEGVCTNCAGCATDSFLKCGARGQLAINNGQGWCKDKPSHPVTYDKAGVNPIQVGSSKTVIGITPNAAIRGKGLRIAHKKNVILHNFRISDINAAAIWGGDGVILYDSDLVWIDKLTFADIGRQFIVTGYESAGRVTISNCFFDCRTQYSATCDGSHYWTVLGYGKSDRVTFSGNLFKQCSGRSPRIANPMNAGGDSVWHVVNTLFDTSTGHSFDMGPGVSVLIEGNVFKNVAQTSLHEATPGRAFAPSDKAVCGQCKGQLGRDCQPNVYENAKPVPSTASAGQVLKDVVGEGLGGALPTGEVADKVGLGGSAAGGGSNGANAATAGGGDGGAKTGDDAAKKATSDAKKKKKQQQKAQNLPQQQSVNEQQQQQWQQKAAQDQQIEEEKKRKREQEEQRRKQVQAQKLQQQQH